MKKSVLFLILAVSFAFTVHAQNGETGNTPHRGTVKIKIIIENNILTAAMADNAAARSFVSLLPLTLTFEDYNRTEKISGIPKKLSATGAPSGYDPQIGDICLYVPWGNLCIFYRDFSYSNGLVLLGKIDGDMSAFTVSGSVTAQFEVTP